MAKLDEVRRVIGRKFRRPGMSIWVYTTTEPTERIVYDYGDNRIAGLQGPYGYRLTEEDLQAEDWEVETGSTQED